jgi:hypothetical protein
VEQLAREISADTSTQEMGVKEEDERFVEIASTEGGLKGNSEYEP